MTDVYLGSLHEINTQLKRIADALEWFRDNWTLAEVIRIPEALENREAQPQQKLPLGELSDQLAPYMEYLTQIDMEGKTAYALKEYDPSTEGKNRWVKINEIFKAHGGKWISEKTNSRWEVST